MNNKQQFKGVIFYTIWYSNVFLSTAFTYYWMHLITHNQLRPILVTSIGQFYALISLYLLGHTLILSLAQKLCESFISLQSTCRCLQKVINNCILYVIILLGLLNVQNYREVYSEEQIILIVQLFIWGRIIFSIGYLLGTWLGAQSLRSYGFGLCIGSLACLFASLSKVNFLRYFE